MVEYIIESKRPDTQPTYKFFRGENKKDVLDQFKKEYPKDTIVSIRLNKGLIEWLFEGINK